MKRSLAGMCVLVALFGAILLSQNTASVSGVVTDPTGAVVPNVAVQVKSIATGAIFSAVTDGTGKYNIALPLGEYEVKIAVPGFKTYITRLTLSTARNNALWNVSLQIGNSSEVVTVTGAAAGGGAGRGGGKGGGRGGPGPAAPPAQADLLKSENAQNVAVDQADNLPVLSIGTGSGLRNPLQVLNLLPGTEFGPGVFNNEIRVNGLPANSQAIKIDGQDVTNGIWRERPNASIYPGRAYYPNTAQYDSYVENEFASVKSEPLSTFSVDVDTASYSNVRRFLNQGQLPPAGAVRIEELINYFTYNYPPPEHGQPVSMTTHLVSDPWNSQRKLLVVGMRTQAISAEELPPSSLTFLLDVSGSMMPAERLPLIKQSMKLLVRQLRAQDRVSIVVYAGAAGVVLPPTPGDRHQVILEAIDRLQAGGSTNGADGIRLAYQMARQAFMHPGNNRVILATDGDFNVGVSSDDELVRLIERERQSGVFLSVLGVGTDNLKDAKMEKLADRGNGNYAYIDSINEAYKVLVKQMGGTLVTVAKDVKLQIEFNPAHVEAWRLVGYENRVLRAEDFNNDRKDAGDLGAGHQVTAIYEIVPVGGGDGAEGVDPLRYQQQAAPAQRSRSRELAWVKLRHKRPGSETSELIEWPVSAAEVAFRSAPADARFAVAVAEYGMLLRQSKFAGSANFEHVIQTAAGALGSDLDGYRAEFMGLAQRARDLWYQTEARR